MPVTSQGYNRDEIDDLRAAIDQYFYDKFGDGTDMSDDQPTGLIAGILSLFDDQLEQLSEGIVNAFYTLKSDGTNIDDHGAEEGIFRHEAGYASVELQIDGYIDPESPTVIPADSQFSTPDGHIFVSEEDVTITEQATIKDENGNDVLLTDDDGNALGRATVAADAYESGSDSNVMPNTIMNAEQSTDGFYAVTNPNGASGGTERESDHEYQLRIVSNRQHPNNSSKSGVETAVLNVEGVKNVRLINNKELTTDEFGNPPKSIHLYVIGGDDQDVADAYFGAFHSLAKTVGTISKTSVDVGDKPQTIYFDRATTVPVYINLAITADANTFDIDNGVNNIKTNIINYFDTLNMGDPVYYSQIFGPIYAVSGIKNVVVTLGVSTDNMAAADVTVDDFELATTAPEDMTITITEQGA